MRKKNSSAQPSGALDVSATSAAASALEDQPPSSFIKRLGATLRRHTLWIPIALALVASLITLANDFACDDAPQIVNNALIKSLANLPAAFTSRAWRFAPFEVTTISQSYYRPLFSVWLMIGNAIFGASTWGWHLMSVLLHAATTAMVFVVIKGLFDKRRLALIAASLFAVLPVHAEAVAWVSGGVDVLMTLLLLAALHFYLAYRKAGRVYQLILALACYLLALWSKEAALAFPLVVAYLELAQIGKSPAIPARGRRLLPFAAGLALVTAVYALMRYLANGAIFATDETRLPPGPALLTIPLAIVKYLALLLWPFGYSYQHYTIPVTSLVSLKLLAPLVLVIVLAFIVARYGSRELRFAGAWFILTLAPVLLAMNRFEMEHLVQERYLYLPSLGFCLAAAFGVEWLAARQSFRLSPDKFAAALVAAAVVFYGIAYILHSRHWSDSLSIYRHAVAVAPDSAPAYTALASEYAFAGRARDAEALAQRAIELDPQYVDGHITLSYLTMQQGNLNKAIDILEQAKSSISPNAINRSKLATLILNIGRLYSQKKDYASATAYARESLAMWPRAAGWYYMALIYSYADDLEESLRLYQEAERRLPPAYSVAHLSLGIIYEGLGRLEEARDEYQKYLALLPPDAPEGKGAQARLKKIIDQLQGPVLDKRGNELPPGSKPRRSGGQ
ncbi:MAG: protein O-mannosyl-transferase [Blastocatellia bacterium]